MPYKLDRHQKTTSICCMGTEVYIYFVVININDYHIDLDNFGTCILLNSTNSLSLAF